MSKNNTSGINGVSKIKNGKCKGKYRVYINKDYKQINLGYYDSLEEAAEIRKKASKKLYGQYANIDI